MAEEEESDWTSRQGNKGEHEKEKLPSARQAKGMLIVIRGPRNRKGDTVQKVYLVPGRAAKAKGDDRKVISTGVPFNLEKKPPFPCSLPNLVTDGHSGSFCPCLMIPTLLKFTPRHTDCSHFPGKE